MTLDEAFALCRAKPGASDDYPFDMDTRVYRVRGKIFVLGNEAQERERLTLKCEPVHALALRDQFVAVEPGYHMNKRHWNTVYLDGDCPAAEIEAMITHSYGRVVRTLTKAEREALSGSTG